MRAILCGANGAMGKLIDGILGSDVVGRVSIDGENGVPKTFAELGNVGGDMLIDFSHHTATPALLEYAAEKNIPIVLCTTGHDEAEMAFINKAAQKIALFHSANMSLGVALLCELAKTAAKTFPDADIEIIEKHHNRKLDAPSGTALLLAREIQKIREKAFFSFGRQGQAKRMKDEIGIHAVRMGNIVGEHEVIVGTDTQTITLKHEAHSRSLFAEGALVAADFIKDKCAGLYDMHSMIDG